MEPDPSPPGGEPAPPATAPPPPPPPPLGERRLRRRRQRRVLAGVAGGIADFLAIDPVLVRVVLVVLVALGGSGVVLYVLLWATIPAEGAQESAAEALLRRVRAAPPWLQAVLAGVVFVLVAQGLVQDGAGIFTGVVLIAIGIALFGRDQLERQAPAPAAPAPVAAPGGGGATRMEWPSIASEPPPPLWDPPVPAPARPRSILGRLTLAVALLVLGIAAVLDRAGFVDLTAERLFALVLTVVGAGLLVGAWRGRARGLLALGILLIPLLATLNFLGPLARGGIGDFSQLHTGVADVDGGEFRHLVGTYELDLSRVEFAEEPAEVAASVGFGELTVVVPPEVAVTVDGGVRGGYLDLLGNEVEGGNLSREVVGRGEEGGGRLVLDVEAGIGSVTVERADRTEGADVGAS